MSIIDFLIGDECEPTSQPIETAEKIKMPTIKDGRSLVY